MVFCGRGCREAVSSRRQRGEQGFQEKRVNRRLRARGKSNCSGVETDDYYSAEFEVDGLEVSYQFKIWEKAPKAVSVLVKENSNILQLLKVGDTLNVTYYLMTSAYPSEWQRTAVRHITLNDQGRLKGHYLVGLEIIENARK
jgi:hypothetical protein